MILEIEYSDRHELIYCCSKKSKKNDKKYKNIIILFHSQLCNIRRLLKNEFSINIPENIRFVYTCGSNLSNLLMRSRYPHSFHDAVPKSDMNLLGCYRCKNIRCTTCKYIVEQDWFMSTTTNQIYTIPYSVNCASSNLVYLITSSFCHSQ